MAGRQKGVLLTVGDVAKLQQEKTKLVKEIAARNERLMVVQRGLDLAEFVTAEVGRGAKAKHPGVKLDAVHLAPENEKESARVDADLTDDDSESAADPLIAHMQKYAAVLKVAQIRDALVKIGFGEKVKARPNYVYGLVYRLTKRGRLIKRGKKYQAAPHSSPDEGETEAVGASVRH
jgi:hypothetical protein